MPIQSNSAKSTAKLRALGKEKPKAMERGLLRAGMRLQAASQKLCPVDTGALKSSAYTEVINTGDPEKVNVEVGYTQHYAIYVHENPNAGKTVGQWKYLEQPARQLRAQMTKDVIQEIRNG